MNVTDRIEVRLSAVYTRLNQISQKTGIDFGTTYQAALTKLNTATVAEENEVVVDSNVEVSQPQLDAAVTDAPQSILKVPQEDAQEVVQEVAQEDEDLPVMGDGAINEPESVDAAPSSGSSSGVSDVSSTTANTSGVLASSSLLPEGKYDAMLKAAAEKYGVEPLLAKAVCYAESSYNPNCTSSSGAMGLMQMMPYNAEEMGVDDPYDPAQNIDGGVHDLANLLERYHGDERRAVAAYNCGYPRVDKYPNLVEEQYITQLPRETQNYLKRLEELLKSVGTNFAVG